MNDNHYEVLNRLNGLKIAHRGSFDEKNPENSMGAFKNCIDRNVSIELDVRMLKDNTLVVFHDVNTYRMTGKKFNLDDVNYDDIKELKLRNSEYNIPRLDEVLKLVNGSVLLDIEIKGNGNNLRICYEICKYLDDYKGNFIIKSFNPLYILWFRINRKNYIRGLLIPRLVHKNYMFRYRIIDFVVRPQFVSVDYRNINLKLLDMYRNRKIPILIFTIKEQDIEKYINFGYIYEK